MLSTKLLILPPRQSDSDASRHAYFDSPGGQQVITWILNIIDSAFEDSECYVSATSLHRDFAEASVNIQHIRNEEGGVAGAIASLATAEPVEDSVIYVCYADILFSQQALAHLSSRPEDVAALAAPGQDHVQTLRSLEGTQKDSPVRTDGSHADSSKRTQSPNDTSAASVGLCRFSPAAVETVRTLCHQDVLSRAADLPTVCEMLGANDLTTEIIDADGECTVAAGDDAVARFALDTKANTLRRLKPVVTDAVIEDQLTFTHRQWTSDPERILSAVASEFDDSSVIVRSSAVTEDGWEESNAGQFESVLDVPATDAAHLQDAIEQVIASYDGNPANQVLIQPMVTDVATSGVVLTRTLERGGPYYVVNYDADGASTQSVTNGDGEALRTLFVHRDELLIDDEGFVDCPRLTERDRYFVQQLLGAVCEIEEVIGCDRLDIEFAISEDGTVRLLQVRPIPTTPATEPADETVADAVATAESTFIDTQTSRPGIVGERTIFGVMPDWNPAEIIGRRPRQLATSLYRELVMDDVWARQRAEYGYRDVRPHPLMQSFAGQPYVDVRAVFNSFVPATVSDELAERLVNHYLDRLEANPELHDKVEFEIALTCLTFDFDRRARPLRKAGFSEADLSQLRDGLQTITEQAIKRTPADLDRVDTVARRFTTIEETDLPPLRRARRLIDDCREHGTLTFAHLARSAFVAVALLRSLRRKGVLSESQVSTFLQSVNTVARQFEADAHAVAAGERSWDDFVEEYGHLRPGTYDITSPSYAAQPETYLRPVVENATPPAEPVDPLATWSTETKRTIEAELEAIGLSVSIDEFTTFLTNAIEGREYAKFVFSRHLSAALDSLAAFGGAHGLSRDQVAHVSVHDLCRATSTSPPGETAEWLTRRVQEGQRQHEITTAIELPPLITDPSQFTVFERPSRRPNFVTEQAVTSEVIALDDSEQLAAEQLNEKIVLVRQADPGYDWLFGHEIAGLVTMYGGTNSHMAIRAAEFGIPAAIGVGTDTYQQLARANVVRLDGQNKNVEVIR